MNEQQAASSTSARQKFTEVFSYLKRYAKNPVLTVRQVPEWDWPTIIIFQTSLAAASGLVAGLVGKSLAKILGGLILLPVSSTAMIAVGSFFIYYTFLYWFKKEISFRKLFNVLVICNIPFMVLHTISSLLPPILLVGFLITSLLLIVALVENFQAPKKYVIRLIGGLFGAYFIFWAINLVSLVADNEKLKTLATPESLQILKDELNSEN